MAGGVLLRRFWQSDADDFPGRASLGKPMLVHDPGPLAAASGNLIILSLQPACWYRWDIARGAVSIGSKTAPGGYVLDGFGGIHPFGTAPAVASTRYWGRDLARGAALAR